MGWESIGECTGFDSDDEIEWIEFCNQAAIGYIKAILGPPPDCWEITTQLHELESGSYSDIGFHSDLPLPEPRVYMRRAKALLDLFNEHVDWDSIRFDAAADLIDEIENTDPEDDD